MTRYVLRGTRPSPYATGSPEPCHRAGRRGRRRAGDHRAAAGGGRPPGRAAADGPGGVARGAPARRSAAGGGVRVVPAGRGPPGRPATVLSLLATPHVGIWAARLLRRLRQGGSAEVPLWADAGHFHALAASAAILTGLEFRILVPLRDGQAVLPTLGRAAFPARRLGGRRGQRRGGRAEVTVADADSGAGSGSGSGVGAGAGADSGSGTDSGSGSDSGVGGGGGAGVASVRVPGGPPADAPGWHAARALYAMAGRTTLTVRLEDLDPHRGPRPWTAPDPLSTEEVDHWRQLLERAWPSSPPCTPTPPRPWRGPASPSLPGRRPYGSAPQRLPGDGFGAVTLSRPPDPAELAATLVRAFQHTKLHALMACTPLYDEVGRGLHYAPWRDDPRPLGGLVQGTYAFFGVTRFWRSRRRTARGCERTLAEFEFALWRRQTWLTAQRLRHSAALTPTGRRMAAALESRLASWLDEPVPEARCPRRGGGGRPRVRWRMHHLRPDPGAVTAAAHAWLDERPAPPPRPTRAAYAPIPGPGAGLPRPALPAAAGRGPRRRAPRPGSAAPPRLTGPNRRASGRSWRSPTPPPRPARRPGCCWSGPNGCAGAPGDPLTRRQARPAGGPGGLARHGVSGGAVS
ncbi:HEXXH motif-containing putative peptide modification protein [Streptomyces sp. M19]